MHDDSMVFNALIVLNLDDSYLTTFIVACMQHGTMASSYALLDLSHIMHLYFCLITMLMVLCFI